VTNPRKTININRNRLTKQLGLEQVRFATQHPKSQALAEKAQQNLLGGVPMSWMTRWPGGFPLFAQSANGAHLIDVDDQRYLDLCLGDTGAMAGHAPDATVQAVIAQAQRGFTYMLPTEDAIWVSAELQRRFGLPFWQMALTATDANRNAIRLAREMTERNRILVFNQCYHGSVDEALVSLHGRKVVPRPGNIGFPINPGFTTRCIEFNDVRALEQALAEKDVACVLAEPAMTNIGIIHPQPGYHDALRDLTRKAGTLLILDETHTLCAGPGGYTQAHHLEPDILTVGKSLGGGIPCAAFGLSAALADRAAALIDNPHGDASGLGGTLAGNALSLAAMRATLEHVLIEANFAKTIPMAEYFSAGVQGVIDELGLPWIVKQLGCRAEYWFRPSAPQNGGEAVAAADAELDSYMHLFALNRGILMTPFHNMALISPEVTEADIDHHTQVFREAVMSLL